MKRRSYRNKAEEEFCKFIEKKGYHPIKRGWPDFLCVNKGGNDIIVVEVKKNAFHPLKHEQLQVMKFLSQHGIKCYRWDPDLQGLEAINSRTERFPKKF